MYELSSWIHPSLETQLRKRMSLIRSYDLWILFLIWASLTSIWVSAGFSITQDFDTLSESRVGELFQQWQESYKKVYKHPEEAKRRLVDFRSNLKYVMEKNSKRGGAGSSGHVVGLNKFADMSNEEFRRKYLSKVKRPAKLRREMTMAQEKEVHRILSCDAPSSLDWRKYGAVTGVKDQGDCGSCWSFSSTGAIEGINKIVNGDLVSLSEQELVDCDSTNDGCEGGYMDYAFEWVVSNGGIDTEADYPYTGEDGTCNTTKEETKAVTIDGYEDVDESDSALLCATVNQPISVGIDGGTLDFQLYTSGIYNGDCSSDPDDIDHAVLVVGYGSEDGEDYWIVKNSWGTSWGIDGYIYILRNTSSTSGTCAINAMASYPTKSSSSPSPSSSPGPPPPPSPPPPPPPPPSPPPPSPSPSQCGDSSYCSSDETCCCILEFFDYCFLYGCCDYENAVCCSGTEYCCPSDYPICDVDEGLCLQSSGDKLGMSAMKRKIAKRDFPWTQLEKKKQKEYPHLEWKVNQFASMRRR
ncbi:unnamed protein product [Rhodiola kirilowii]